MLGAFPIQFGKTGKLLNFSYFVKKWVYLSGYLLIKAGWKTKKI